MSDSPEQGSESESAVSAFDEAQEALEDAIRSWKNKYVQALTWRGCENDNRLRDKLVEICEAAGVDL